MIGNALSSVGLLRLTPRNDKGGGGVHMIEEIKKLQKEIVKNRRYLHKHAEVGFDLENTVSYVWKCLESYGFKPKKCGKSGVTADLGEGDGAVLLRADMDALPIREETGGAFACRNGNMHACGHDLHTAALLGAAKYLKMREKELGGRVRFLFQPAEEILEGAKDAVQAGALKGVRAAVMLHVLTAVPLKAGTIVVSSGGAGAPAADFFTIQVKGKGCHGSSPQNGVDALTAAAYILLGLQEISAREISVAQPAVLTVGSLLGGKAGNVIADTAELKGTLRAFDEGTRLFVKGRLQEVSEGIAGSFRASAKVRFDSGCPVLFNDENVSKAAERALKKAFGAEWVRTSKELTGGVAARSGGSEDFAYISREVPSVMLALAAGEAREGYEYPLHHPKTAFDESVLWRGSAAYAAFAIELSDLLCKS